jgi:DNA repair protein RecO (recombination protein O)
MSERVDTAAIVVQRFAWGETSQIVHLLTEALGRVVVLAKGAHRDKNSFEGPLDLLVKGEVSISLVRGRELGLLTRRRVVTNHPRLRLDLARFAGASHVLEQLLHFEPVGAGPSESYRLFERALAALETVERRRVPLLLLAFDARLAQLHGLTPDVSACVRCGSPRSLARFVASDGGVVCASCLTRSDEGERIDRDTAELLRQLAVQPLAALADPPSAVLSRARRLLDVHLGWHAEAGRATMPGSPRPSGPTRRNRTRA